MERYKIKVAIAGVGNCASSLIHGKYYYQRAAKSIGLIHPKIGKYKVEDIEFVAAFDVDKRKVGQDLGKAIVLGPNCAAKFSKVPMLNVEVKKGLVMDGVAKHMKKSFQLDSKQKVCDVVAELRKSEADMLVCYLPVGSVKASRYYAMAALQAGVSFINAIPEFICSNAVWIQKFKARHLVCAGDDIKSQVGATIVHRVLGRLIIDRGMKIENMYQLNIGGNTDFENMTDEFRLASKRISKTQAVTSIIEDDDIEVRIGPSDYVHHLRDTKVCFINITGKQFGGLPFELDLKLKVEDSPNSAGVMVDVIRTVKLALDRELSGYLDAVSAYYFKSPQNQYPDDIARRKVEEFINDNTKTIM